MAIKFLMKIWLRWKSFLNIFAKNNKKIIYFFSWILLAKDFTKASKSLILNFYCCFILNLKYRQRGGWKKFILNNSWLIKTNINFQIIEWVQIRKSPIFATSATRKTGSKISSKIPIFSRSTENDANGQLKNF